METTWDPSAWLGYQELSAEAGLQLRGQSDLVLHVAQPHTVYPSGSQEEIKVQPLGLTTAGVLVCPGRVQQEIDEVIGQERPPEMEDQAHMPFTMAVVHEVQRFADIIPLGVPHMTSRDIEVQGFLIPKVVLWPSSPQLNATCHLVAPAWPLPVGPGLEPKPSSPHFHRHCLSQPGRVWGAEQRQTRPCPFRACLGEDKLRRATLCGRGRVSGRVITRQSGCAHVCLVARVSASPAQTPPMSGISCQGTTLFTNLSSVLKDETVWKMPFRFHPEHFLDDQGHFVKHSAFMPFSAGVCGVPRCLHPPGEAGRVEPRPQAH